MRTKLFTIGLLMFAMTIAVAGQTRQEKSKIIIEKYKLKDVYKGTLAFQLDALKSQARGKDSIRVVELEEQVSENVVENKILSAFDELFSDEEISVMYEFVLSSAYEKLANQALSNKAINEKFSEIQKEIKQLAQRINMQIAITKKDFAPIPVEREDGFYETVDYDEAARKEDVKLLSSPSISLEDIAEVIKEKDSSNPEKWAINIVFTNEGSKKFFLLTQRNIQKPIAFVSSKQIISMPIVKNAINGGKARFGVPLSEHEVDQIIVKFKKK